jgi:hypothetical protein
MLRVVVGRIHERSAAADMRHPRPSVVAEQDVKIIILSTRNWELESGNWKVEIRAASFQFLISSFWFSYLRQICP